MRGRDFDRTARIRSKLGSDNPEGAVTSFEPRAWAIERPWLLSQAENFIDVEHFPPNVFPGFTSTTNLECSQCFVSLGINSAGVRLNRARKTIVGKRQQMAILNFFPQTLQNPDNKPAELGREHEQSDKTDSS